MKPFVGYLVIFGFFVALGWTFRQELQTAQRLQDTVFKEAVRMRESVEALNARVLRYEQEYERRFEQLYQWVASPQDRVLLDLEDRLQTLEQRP